MKPGLLLRWLTVLGMLAVLARPAFAVPSVPDYLIGPGDVLKITVYESPELTTEARVQGSGRVRFPLLDSVQVGGISAEQAADSIAKLLRDGGYVVKPHVSVAVSEYRSQQVSVLGQVAKPGLYPLDRPMRLSELLAEAGGVLPTASDELVLQRHEGEVSHRYTVNQKHAFVDGKSDLDFPMLPGDLLFAPKAPLFYIEGEIAHPGVLPLEIGMNVHQAVAAAGGVGPRGSEEAISLKRRDDKGQVVTRPALLDEPVEENDILLVAPWEFYIYGEVQKPGPYRVEKSRTLMEALAIAGGPTPRGNGKSLRVYHRKRDGTVDVTEDARLTDLVAPNDVVFVKERLF